MKNREKKLISMDEALRTIASKNDPYRNTIRSKINSACNEGTILFTTSGNYEKDHLDAFLLDKENILLLDLKSFSSWLMNQNSIELPQKNEYSRIIYQTLEPDWNKYSKRDYLSLKEWACLLEDIAPKRYRVRLIHDKKGNPYYEHDLPEKFVEMIDHNVEIISGSTGLDLKAIEVNHEPNYVKAEFVNWALEKEYSFSKEFQKSFAVKAPNENQQEQVQIDILDKNHPCYSPKLVAAINAWGYAVSKHGKSQKTPKKLIEKWLEENKIGIGFTLSNTLKEEISNVVNFREKRAAMSRDEMLKNAENIETYRSDNVTTNLRQYSQNKVLDDT